MGKNADVISSAIEHLNLYIEEIESALSQEKNKIKKASYRRQIFDEMSIKAGIARSRMIEELNKIIN